MAWYYGTYSCGHEGRTQVYGPVKNRQWIADRRFEGLCPECYKKKLEEERQKANEEAARKAEEMGLPELQGTEKQVAWATTLRQKFIDEAEKEIEYQANRYPVKKAGKTEEVEAKLYEILDYILSNKTKASWWIDRRSFTVRSMFESAFEEMPTEEEVVKKEKEAEIKAEATVYPENSKHQEVSEINISENLVSATFKKDDKFIEIVKKLGYKWNSDKYQWEKKISYTTGTAEERAAELGNKLLNAGIPVRILDPEVRKNAIEGRYEPEHHRWIYARVKGKYEGWLAISWDGYNNELYQKARSLPGARWDNPNVVVKPEFFVEVEEFARLYDFKFTPTAREYIETEKKAAEKAQVVNPAEVKEKKEKDGLKEILESSSEVLDDLKDD